MFHHHDKKAVVVEKEITTTETITAAPVVETLVHKEAVKETIKRREVEEIQPVIAREIETTEVHHVTQPIYEKEVLATRVQEAVLPTVVRADVGVAAPLPTMEHIHSDRIIETAEKTTIIKPTIVQERVIPHVIEEVQPIVYREIVENTLIKEVQPIKERVVVAPVVVEEVRAPIVQASSRTTITSTDRLATEVEHVHITKETQVHKHHEHHEHHEHVDHKHVDANTHHHSTIREKLHHLVHPEESKATTATM
eukprot:TRINITY_DN944_c0_g1_i3.p1 TRINITY_DN944_c0_g1~~TRINITY_DN944_c0_g1_i3.p1  ORF type:complete len:286 (+),score=110.10 TRINITY_DN944_c0_g1_i3:101-859(+)